MTWTANDRELRAGLEAEWADWCRGEGGDASAPELVERCRNHDDDVWSVVVRAAQSGQVAAARLALQALLPSLVRMSTRDRTRPLAEYVTAAWLRIYDHPIERRNRRVLTNLTLDTLKALTRERDVRTWPQPPEWFDESRHPDEVPEGERAQRVITAAARLGVITASAAPVLRSVYVDGLSGRQAAARHRESPEMVRYRCSRAVRQMQAARIELMDAA